MLKSLIAALKRKRAYRFRSSVTGKWVSAAYAVKHPDITIRERII